MRARGQNEDKEELKHFPPGNKSMPFEEIEDAVLME
jgi:hypothetical protein